MRSFFASVTLLGSVIGGLFVILGLVAESAPKMAAYAAVGIGFSVVPYIITRLLYLSHAEESAAARHQDILNAIRQKN